MTRGQGSKRKETRVKRVRRLTAGLLHHCAPAWSPDGRILCFALGRGPDSHWLLTDRKGRAARVLPGPVVGGASLAADHSVAYGRQVGATAELWILTSTGAQPHRLLGGDGRLYRDPAFSPDGRLLCYAADDGPSGHDATLQLWLFDLTRLSHTLLVPAPPTIEGATGPVRAGHPAWSPAGDCVFFDVTQGEHRAVCRVDVESREVRLLTGSGFGRPAPIAADLMCVERAQKDGRSELCLLHFRAPRASGEHSEAEEASSFKVRTATLYGLAEGAREPAVAVSKKGAVRLAWTAPGRTKGGEPQRYDVHAGSLQRLPSLRAARAGSPTAAGQEGDVSALHRQAAAAAAGLSQKSLAEDEAPADAERGV